MPACHVGLFTLQCIATSLIESAGHALRCVKACALQVLRPMCATLCYQQHPYKTCCKAN